MTFAILNVPLGLSEVAAFATGASAYPSANMPLAFILSAPAMLTLGMVYALFTAAMPRSGGDYVWASRILHPSIGFGVNFFVSFILLSSAGLNSLLMATWFLPPVFHIIGLDNVAAFCADTTGFGAVTVGTIVTLLLLGVFLLGLRRVRQIMFGLFAFIMAGTIFWLILLFVLPHSDFVASFNAGQGSGAYQSVLNIAAKAGFGTPQRVATGYDGRRLALLLAVLDKRAGLSFASLDVFLNVVGGVRLQEPAGDLAVAAALASSVYERALPADGVFIGEVGLGGEVRPVSQVERRIAEAANMGMTRVFVAERGVPKRAGATRDVQVIGVRTITQLFEKLFA